MDLQTDLQTGILYEKELIEKFKNGDSQAFAALYERYAEYALRTGAAVTKNHTWAADAVQETFIRIYNNISSFDAARPFKPWLYKILINECNRILKRNTKNMFWGEFSPEEHPAMDFHGFEEYEELYLAIRALNDTLRIPIVLRYLDEFSEKEIAAIIGVNVNTVKSRLFKGRQKLRQRLIKRSEGSVHHG